MCMRFFVNRCIKCSHFQNIFFVVTTVCCKSLGKAYARVTYNTFFYIVVLVPLHRGYYWEILPFKFMYSIKVNHLHTVLYLSYTSHRSRVGTNKNKRESQRCEYL
jgi:hypothetical protein